MTGGVRLLVQVDDGPDFVFGEGRTRDEALTHAVLALLDQGISRIVDAVAADPDARLVAADRLAAALDSGHGEEALDAARTFWPLSVVAVPPDAVGPPLVDQLREQIRRIEVHTTPA